MAPRCHLHLHGFTCDDFIRSVDEHHLQRELLILARMESGFMALLPGHHLRRNSESVDEKVQKASALLALWSQKQFASLLETGS